MKLSTIANQILSEGRTEPITDDVVVQLLHYNCSDYMKNINRPYKLYRGIRDARSFDYGIIDPKKFTRTSLVGNNYGTLIVDNSPIWREFPSRSKGIICTTNKNYARSYGLLYVVIPYDGTLMGICPDSDIWNSFTNTLDDLFGMVNVSVAMFYRIIDLIGNTLGINIDETSWQIMKSDMEKVGNILLSDTTYEQSLDNNIVKEGLGKELIYQFKKSKYDSFYKFIEAQLDPKKNGFRTDVWPLAIPDNREVWFSAKSLYIRNALFDGILEKYKNEYEIK